MGAKHFTANSIPLAVYGHKDNIFLYSKTSEQDGIKLHLDISHNGSEFTPHQMLIFEGRKHPATSDIEALHITPLNNRYFMTFKRQTKGKPQLFGAFSHDLANWQERTAIDTICEAGVLVPQQKENTPYVLYFGEKDIRIATSDNLKQWKIGPQVLAPTQDFYGEWPLAPAGVRVTDQGILLFYYQHFHAPSYERFILRAALFDLEQPEKLIRNFTEAIWETPKEWWGQEVHPVGIVEKDGQLLSFWWIKGIDLVAVYHPLYRQRLEEKSLLPSFTFNKLHHNPILSPIIHHFWESRATFNPAAFEADDRIHLVYRAIGDHDVSVLGYAESRDGFHVDYRHPDPVYVPSKAYELSCNYTPTPHSSPFASGGGCYGGCEDPRITKIDNRLYMTYVAYDGWSPPRVALTSIAVADFLNHSWNWQAPVLISPPGVVDKNACILPEKINGKYVIFHRIFPNILVDFVDSLDFDGQSYLKGEHSIAPRQNHWDSRKLGAGAPPIKTDDGWLLIYQAVDDRDDRKYKIGAMLLDYKNPTQVLHRSDRPFIEPTEWYENVGHKAGVAYPCGAVVKDGKLIVYYGGADTVVCAATTELDAFLSYLKSHNSIAFEKISPVVMN